jgi:hypothetical protein
MAKYVATDHTITINGSSFGTSIQSVDLAFTADELETTAFGGTWRERVVGLKTGSITINFFQDFQATTGVDAVLYPLFGSNATVVIKPTSGTTGTSNPAYTAVCTVSQYQPFASSVGDIATVSVTWPTTGTVTRATA